METCPLAGTPDPDPLVRTFPNPRSQSAHAHTLVSIARIGSLSTHSQKVAGFPFGSVMPYAIDDLGWPVFFISSMAMHTQNLHHGARASLLITQPDSSGDPLGRRALPWWALRPRYRP